MIARNVPLVARGARQSARARRHMSTSLFDRFNAWRHDVATAFSPREPQELFCAAMLPHAADEATSAGGAGGAGGAGAWKVFSDADMGGGSSCTLDVARDDHGAPTGVVFRGTTACATDGMGEGTKRSGFCGVQWPIPALAQDVMDLDTLALKFRVPDDAADAADDGASTGAGAGAVAGKEEPPARRFIITVKPESSILDDLYQGVVVPPRRGGDWVVAELPFEAFKLTGRGRVKHHQRELDARRIEAVGVTVADGEDGPFALELAWVKALDSKAPPPDDDDPSQR